MGYFKHMASVGPVGEREPSQSVDLKAQGLAQAGGVETRGTFITTTPATRQPVEYIPSVPGGDTNIGYDRTGRITIATSARMNSVSRASFDSAEPMPPLKVLATENPSA